MNLLEIFVYVVGPCYCDVLLGICTAGWERGNCVAVQCWCTVYGAAGHAQWGEWLAVGCCCGMCTGKP